MGDALYYASGWGMVALAVVTVWAALTPGQLLFIG
jgi:hypothetical protein